MKEAVAVASWAVLLLSDLGQSHLLLGKSHVQKNGVNGSESERASEEVVVCGGGGGGLRKEGGGGDGWRWKERRQKAAGLRSVLSSDRERSERQKETKRGGDMEKGGRDGQESRRNDRTCI